MAMLPQEEFVQRRTCFLNQLPDSSVAVIFSSQEQIRNKDCYYPFRQDSYFWYLTGFNEPNAVLVLSKKNGQHHSVLFLRPSDPEMEIWDGRRLGLEKAPEKLILNQALDIADFTPEFAEIIKNHTALFYAEQVQPWGDMLLQPYLNNPKIEKQDWQPMLDEMRLFKSDNEIRLMQQAAQITAFGHIKAMQQVRPNRLEYEIESEIHHEFNRFGARFVAYNTIVASGENACILHYTDNNQALKEGDLVLVDAGCEFAGYAGDITRTFPVNGKFNQAQREIYELVLKAQKRAIELLIAGNSIQMANDEVVRIKVAGLVELGILQGDVEALIEQNAHRQFYMHGLGHWLGLDVHDVGSYSNDKANPDRNSKKRDRTLQVGMVLTVEPGLYISPNANVPAQYKGIGVRIEDNILITEYGNKILTCAVPKEINEIERLMGAEREFIR